MTDFDQMQDTVYALAAAPNGVIFAGRASGVQRSDDGGASWQDAYAMFESDVLLTTTALAAAPDSRLFAGVNGGVLRSSDGGGTWFAASFGSPPPLVTALAVSPNFEQDGVVLAATAEDGLYSSTDRGTIWTPWNFGLIDLNAYSLALSPDFARDQTAYIGTETGVFRSTNGGRAWRVLPFPIDSAPVLSLAVTPNVVLAGTESSGLYRSTDRGKTWVQVIPEGSVSALSVQSDALWALVDDRILRSTDDGQTWAAWPQADFGDQQPLALLVHDRAVFVGFADGAIRRFG
jgi:photosystem II stability/assembly factor-like uncharacterized protein